MVGVTYLTLKTHVMKSLFALTLLISSFGSAQPIEELFYMNYIDSLMANELTGVKEYEGQDNSYQALRGYYYNNELVALQTFQKGELANFTRCTYYMKDNKLFSSSQHKCRTNEYEILDLDLYSEKNRDSLGSVDYSKLPTNCMTVKLFYQSEKMTREIEGMDVFDPLESYSERKEADASSCRQLLAELERYSGL